MTAAEIKTALSAPFDTREVQFKPQMVKNNRCLAMAYVSARVVQDRLDELGVENWQDRYSIMPDGGVVCRLAIKIEGKWITKTDVGSPSEQPDSGDRLKAAFSDALKRAAVKFGIGRYLYRLPAQWVDYDPVKKQIVSPPQLPDWAVPGKQMKRNAPATTPPKKATADDARARFAKAANLKSLGEEWEKTPADLRSQVVADKERRKKELAAV
jgi:hypothetical protein